MRGRSALVRGVVVVGVFAVSLAVGNALGEDEHAAAPLEPAKRATVAVGPLRLEPAQALPELRAAPARPRPRSAQAESAAPVPVAPAAPAAGSEGVPAETGGSVAPTPTPPVSSPPAEQAPSEPPADPPQSTTDAPHSATPGPDPAPAPAPVPAPDPAPQGGSGQYDGP
jgi:hypothetical protein